MSQLAISVKNLSKKYQIGILRHDTLRDQLAHTFSRASVAKKSNGSIEGELWALRDISFEVNQGEVVGIIGRNGAGKSTLLKIISHITDPTTGRIEIYGRIGSLLEVGTGFHPELTGRENIFMNGAILGMRRKEISERFDEIVDFAQIEKFIDTPVKRYSSGMYVRLAFAVAAHLQPEILIVDEVLAVGDVAFQRKCLGKMGDIASQGRTVLFVSHNMSSIQTLCNRGIYIRDGRIERDGTIDKAISYYLSTLENSVSIDIKDRRDRSGRGNIHLIDIDIRSSDESPTSALATGRSAKFIFYVSDLKPGLTCTFTIFDQRGFAISSFRNSLTSTADTVDPGLRNAFACEIEELMLLPGHYRIDVGLRLNDTLEDRLEGAAYFDVEQGQLRGRPAPKDNNYSSITMPHRWRLPIQIDHPK